jgi:hypothetical protein
MGEHMTDRILVIGGREINLNMLGQPLDEAFDQLHAAYLSNGQLSWNSFVTAALQFFDNNPASPGAHDAYFNNFTVL